MGCPRPPPPYGRSGVSAGENSGGVTYGPVSRGKNGHLGRVKPESFFRSVGQSVGRSHRPTDKPTRRIEHIRSLSRLVDTHPPSSVLTFFFTREPHGGPLGF